MPGIERTDPGRTVALEQIAGLRMAYERRRTLPARMTVKLGVRSQDATTLELVYEVWRRGHDTTAHLRASRNTPQLKEVISI